MTTTTHENAHRVHEADLLYERFGKPFEAQHLGQFVAIAEDGRTIVGATLLTVAQAAEHDGDAEWFVFKIGERSVGRIR